MSPEVVCQNRAWQRCGRPWLQASSTANPLPFLAWRIRVPAGSGKPQRRKERDRTGTKKNTHVTEITLCATRRPSVGNRDVGLIRVVLSFVTQGREERDESGLKIAGHLGQKTRFSAGRLPFAMDMGMFA